MNDEQQSLYENLMNYKNKKFISLHVPGHKNNFFKDLFLIDTTELPETDNLNKPENIIKSAEEFASKLFKSKRTVFCTGGNTLCIQTMLRLCAPEGGKIICTRTIHKSAINAMSLLGIIPIWILPCSVYENPFLPGMFCPESFEFALKNNPDANGVFVTSPNYYGEMSDIHSISSICKKYNVPLMVDNAHGSHLQFLKPNLHPINLGADLCADSAHKTLPVLTGGAFLHINNYKFVSYVKESMSIFASTSPSYPIMASLDLATHWLKKYGETEFEKLKLNIKKIKKIAKNKGFLLPQKNIDPIRITLNASTLGYTGQELFEYFRKYKIQPEFYEKNYVILIPSPFNNDKDLNKLANIISKINKKRNQVTNFNFSVQKLPKTSLILREAFLKKFVKVKVDDAKGKVAAEIICPCPPAVPLIMPGEIIDDDIINNFKFFDIFEILVIDSFV